MAVNTWSSAGSTDGNLVGNWSLGALAATDTLTFDATSVINCTFTAAVSCASIIVNATYSGNLSDGGFKIGSSGAQSYTGNAANTLTWNGEHEITGDANMTIGTGWGTITISTSTGDIDLQGTGNYTNNSGVNTLKFHKMTCAASGKTTTENGSNRTLFIQFTIGAGTLSNGTRIEIYCTAQSDLTFDASHTLSGAGIFRVSADAAITLDIPKINGSGHTGAVWVYAHTANISTYDFKGNLVNGGTVELACLGTNSAATTFTFNTYNLSQGGGTAGTFLIGSNGGSGVATYNFGSGTITVFVVASYGGTFNVNKQTSVWVVNSNYSISGTVTNDAGTSSTTFSGAAAQNITSNNTLGNSFYDITINRATAGTLTFANACSCHSLTASATNTQVISWTGTTMTSSGNINLLGTGTHIFGNGITLTGAASTFHIDTTLTAPTATSCVLTFNGAACVFDDDKGSTIKNLVTGAAGAVSFTGAASTTFSDTASIILGSGTSIPASFTWSATLATLVASTLVCTGSLTFAAGQTVTGTAATQSVTFTNTATITSNNKAFPGAVVFNAAGKTFTLADAIVVSGNYTFTAGTLAGAFSTTCVGNVTVMVSMTFNRLILTKATTRILTVNAGITLTLTNLAAANFSGTVGALTQVRSFVPGVRFIMAIPNAVTLTYFDSQDCEYQGFDVTANDGTSMTRGNNLRYLTFNVVTVIPITGADAGGTIMTFTDTGNGFGGTCTVTVGGAAATGVTIIDTQHLTATSPAGTAGVVNIVVTNGDGEVRTLVGGYTYEAPVRTSGESRCYISASIGI